MIYKFQDQNIRSIKYIMTSQSNSMNNRAPGGTPSYTLKPVRYAINFRSSS